MGIEHEGMSFEKARCVLEALAPQKLACTETADEFYQQVREIGKAYMVTLISKGTYLPTTSDKSAFFIQNLDGNSQFSATYSEDRKMVTVSLDSEGDKIIMIPVDENEKPALLSFNKNKVETIDLADQKNRAEYSNLLKLSANILVSLTTEVIESYLKSRADDDLAYLQFYKNSSDHDERVFPTDSIGFRIKISQVAEAMSNVIKEYGSLNDGVYSLKYDEHSLIQLQPDAVVFSVREQDDTTYELTLPLSPDEEPELVSGHVGIPFSDGLNNVEGNRNSLLVTLRQAVEYTLYHPLVARDLRGLEVSYPHAWPDITQHVIGELESAASDLQEISEAPTSDNTFIAARIVAYVCSLVGYPENPGNYTMNFGNYEEGDESITRPYQVTYDQFQGRVEVLDHKNDELYKLYLTVGNISMADMGRLREIVHKFANFLPEIYTPRDDH